MAQNYDLAQTGPELQARINQVYPNRDAIEQETVTREEQDESLETSLKAYTDTEQARAEAAEGALDTRVSTNEVDIDLLKSEYEALTQSDIIVGPLPSTGQPNKIYRVPGSTYYTDYMWANGGWVKLAEYSTLDGYVYKGIATPSGTPVQSAEAIFYFAVEPGTYTNYGGLVVTNTIAILKFNGTDWTKDDLIAIDNEPTAGSENLVTSGAVAASVVYDISAANAVGGQLATYADLAAALDGGTNVPVDVRKGGMEIKFVQSSDNKYVQYRLMADEWSIDTVDWACIVDTIEIENDVYLEVKLDNEGKILWALKADGTVFFGAGCPPQVQEFVIKHLATKVDKVENKSLIDTDVANSMSCIENSEYLSAETDDEDKILSARKRDGKIKEFVGIETPLIDVAQLEVIERLLLGETAKEELKYDLSLNTLPKYYFENDYIVDKVNLINDIWLHTGAYADIFVFFTDAHYFNNAKMTAFLMEYLLKNACIGKVVYGGDTASNGSIDIVDDIEWENITAKTIVKYSKYFPIEGNHDYYTDEVVLPLSAVRNNLLNSCNVEGIKINEDDVAPYYYYDEAFSKIRYIIADVFYSGSFISFGSEQISFIAQALSSTPNGYSIVIMSHTNIQNGVIHDTTEYERLESMRKLVKAYQDKGSTTISGVTYDFTNAQSSIVLYIGGHGHEDLQNYIDNTLYLGIPCTALWQDAKYSPMYTYHQYQDRQKGNIYEDCFDVIILDKSNNVLNCVRIGWGFNRRYNLARIDMSVGSTEQLTSIFNTVAKWLIHDSTGATYNSSISYGSERWTFTNNVATTDNNGMVTALSAGECYAIAIADNGDKEFFYIKVQ